MRVCIISYFLLGFRCLLRPLFIRIRHRFFFLLLHTLALCEATCCLFHSLLYRFSFCTSGLELIANIPDKIFAGKRILVNCALFFSFLFFSFLSFFKCEGKGRVLVLEHLRVIKETLICLPESGTG